MERLEKRRHHILCPHELETMKTNKFKSDYKTSELPAYRKMRSATHRFKETALYSFADVAQIIGLTHEAVRKRAIIDQWPCVEIFIRAGRVRRPHFVPGEFLANLQLNGDSEK